MQLCNERFRIRCFLTKNDPEWHALCSRRTDCSVPLRECFNNQLQLIAERGPNKSSVVFLVASLVFRSEALSSGYSIASFQLGSSFGFWAKDTLDYVSLRGRFRSPIGVQGSFRRSPGELLRAPGRLKMAKMGPILDQFESQGGQKQSKSGLRVI